jgi:hypothetical protein
MKFPEIKKTSRVEFRGPGGKKEFALVYKRAGDKLVLMADDGMGYNSTVNEVKLSDEPMTFDHPSKRFGPGDRIEFQSKSFKGTKTGSVNKVDMFGMMQVTADDGMIWDVFAKSAEPSKTPAPKGVAANPTSYAKGDRVEFTQGGTIIYGVVSRGGSSVKVIHDGGEKVTSGDARAFRPSQQPLKKDSPDAMDRWTLASYKAIERRSRETTCFDAKIALDGKPVIEASNDGGGGCNFYRPLPGAPKGVCDKLEADAKAWRIRVTGKEPEKSYGDDADMWISWKADKQPYGVTAAAYWADFEEIAPAATSPAM